MMDDETKRYIVEKFGKIHPVFEQMEKYNPDILKGYIAIRKALLPSDAGKTAISEKTKELIIVAVEVAAARGDKGVSHARRAVRAGATPEEVHEAVSIVAMLCGWATYVDAGVEAVKAAEEEVARMQRGESPAYSP